MPSQNILEHLTTIFLSCLNTMLNATAFVKMCSPMANVLLVNPVRYKIGMQQNINTSFGIINVFKTDTTNTENNRD